MRRFRDAMDTLGEFEPFFIKDDCFEISEEVMNMTDEERDELIARLEAEGRREKERIEREKAAREGKAV